MARTILVVDDEEAIRSSLAGALSDEGYKVMTTSDGSGALDSMAKEFPDVVMLDVWMTSSSGERQQEGLDILARIKMAYPHAIVVIMSGHGNIETAVKATKLGAYDFLEKPLSLDKVLVTLQNAFQLKDLSRENENLRARVAKSKVMVGNSTGMRQLQQAIKRVAPTSSWILITGENGTGKELVAHSIHALSARYDKPFIEVNCAAIPEELIESELFGHEKGSFTGASHQKRGKFEVANGGTLFLDEIGDMSIKTQAKILRILQEQRFERVGGSQTIEVDVRVIAATNKDLESEIRKNQFREDLYYRLNVIPFRIPPLRERKEDISLIAAHYLKEFTPPGEAPKQLSNDALAALEKYGWPGNVRELKNMIERLVIFTDGPVIEASDVMILIAPKDKADLVPINSGLNTGSVSQDEILSLKDAKSEFEREFILRKLKENDWNVSKTAQILGVERSHLHRKIKSYGIEESLQDEVK